jgi:hypothetical protein
MLANFMVAEGYKMTSRERTNIRTKELERSDCGRWW